VGAYPEKQRNSRAHYSDRAEDQDNVQDLHELRLGYKPQAASSKQQAKGNLKALKGQNRSTPYAYALRVQSGFGFGAQRRA
jgi:hypothetical protein